MGTVHVRQWERGKQITLEANDDYWGEKPAIDQAIIVAIDDPKARADALANGEIDGFDLVGPADIKSLEDQGFQIENRDPFNILYLGMNQKVKPRRPPGPPGDRLRPQQGRDRERLDAGGHRDGLEFVPPTVNGYTEDVTQYDYDPEKAKQLLQQAGADGATIEFNYPTGVSRPYMPQPEDTFNVIRTQLQAVGLKIKPTADQWDPDYLEKIQGTPDHGIHLLGWTGDYNDTDNFLGVFFGTATAEWGFTNQQLFDDLKQARGLPTVEEQPVYEKINQEVMDFLQACRWRTRAVPGLLTGRAGLPAQPRPGRGLEHHLARLTPARGSPDNEERRRCCASCCDASSSRARARGALAAVVHLGPGPARRPGAGPPGGEGDAEGLARVTEAYGFDEPVLQQYVTYVTALLHGDFGNSIQTGQPVTESFLEKFPATIELGLAALLLAVVVGVPLGHLAARHQGRPLDTLVVSGSLLGVVTPVFFLAILLKLVFADTLHWLPTALRQDPRIDATHITNFYVLDGILTQEWDAAWDAIVHLILPAVALATSRSRSSSGSPGPPSRR